MAKPFPGVVGIILLAAAAYGLGRMSGQGALSGSREGANRGVPVASTRPAAPCCNLPATRFAVAVAAGMRWIPAGEFTMGSDAADARPDERPRHRVHVDGYWIDTTLVTNAQFRVFVEATGHVTTAERAPTMEEIMKQLPPGTPLPAREALVAASMVFHPPDAANQSTDALQWWAWVPGADWRHPEGPGSNIDGKDDHPVVQVSWDDAAAYAKWAGKRLPTEAEFEYAARGGLDGKTFAWGDEPISEEHPQCNVWQGEFPRHNLVKDGYARTSPVGAFPANGYGLYDMAGNVWEWCGDWYRADAYAANAAKGLVRNPAGPNQSLDPDEPFTPKRVTRGGSFLCHASYCASYRAAARMKTSPDSSTNHIGFRCVKSGTVQETH